MLRRILQVLLGAIVVLAGVFIAAGKGWFGSHEGPGEVLETRRPVESIAHTERAVADAATAIGVPQAKQVLFGDLHVHSTFSLDAFMLNLPVVQGEGAHPPADACDFARFCSALDFWSINDHAEGITPRNWRETVDSIRQCNAVAGDPSNPDTVAFLGWEWSQIGTTPDDHYGHKNVVLAHTEDEQIPTRPIAAGSVIRMARPRLPTLGQRAFLSLLGGHPRYRDTARFLAERAETDLCDPDQNVRDLPDDCLEYADTPADLYRKLDEWGHDSMVIPHGTTWGLYTPPGSVWDKQLEGAMHDPDRQKLLEIYSGHGDSDFYRDWRAVEFDAEGNAVCPEPRPSYLPSCWRAGEIIRERCQAEGRSEEDCEERAVKARSLAAEAGGQGHLTVAGESFEDWLDAGQCRDCDQPAFNYRPGGSAQYIMALGNFDDSGDPRRFRFGFMSSSDNHFARPGTGYKEKFRRGMTESIGQRARATGILADALLAPPEEPVAQARPFDRENAALNGLRLFELERQASFFMTGGLVAVHSSGRDRGAIWDALQRKEVYGTSGPRILLWFDLLNPPGSGGGTTPMGGGVEMTENPIFQVRAVGSFAQLAGCPDDSSRSLGPERLQHLCKGECYNPSDLRRPITRIEVIRIQPQMSRGEEIAGLIQDPWRSFACDPDPAGCAVTFVDPDFAAGSRDTLYYARVYEEPAPGVNAGNLRCEFDEEGSCVKVNSCPGPQGAADDCLSEHEPRAWSSPIFVDFAG
jgi:hypothetical protein